MNKLQITYLRNGLQLIQLKYIINMYLLEPNRGEDECTLARSRTKDKRGGGERRRKEKGEEGGETVKKIRGG